MIAPALRRRVAPATRNSPAWLAAALVAAAAGGAANAGAAGAAGTSDWVGDSRSAFRLIAGAPDHGALRAGVEIKLSPGWKTYWRYPGDSGVAPRFDFTGSSNVKAVDVSWPAPHVWRDEAGTAIGYKGAVIFPLRVTAHDTGQPVHLKLAFDYAICGRVCIPVAGAAELALSAAAAGDGAALAAAQAQVPKPSTVGADGPLAVRAVTVKPPPERPLIEVDVVAPQDVAVDVLAEGPTPDWSLPVPAPAGAGPDGTRRFTFTLDGAPPGVDALPRDLALTLTVVAGERAVAVPFRLDGSPTPGLR